MTTPLPPAGSLRRPPGVEAEPFGDSALMLRIADEDAEARRAGARRLRDILLDVRPYGVLNLVSGAESLLVEFDCLAVSHGQLAQTIRLAVAGMGLQDAGPVAGAKDLVVPMVVSGEFSPDLPGVAQELGLSQEATLSALTSSVLTINLLAAAMAPMMAGVNFPGQVSRCAEPRTDVPPGSVMVAGTSAIIQPFPGPSGWKVIGRTPLTICDIHEDPATSYRPGDRVRFEIIPESRWAELEGRFLRPAHQQEGGRHGTDA
ncbi:carboxyltransferase domain-containing protein [Pseudarthrobacter chlorophenolicus]|uniref:carboxyltransferase domain-containing protein n=1 Tax=Pseudarthrobacter chlorophenolicus TaxID=85085 RepID=UPI0009E400A3|nr:carboxyltransferase domain-containing protein [Pseudarthrobacter chlorophenolicus]